MQILRQSTSVVVRVGPAVAVADGFTPVTNLAVSSADEAEALRANTATLDISGATFAAVTGADGWYSLTLDTTATNTVGVLDIVINDDSLILPIFARFQVVEEAVYDQMFAASALGAAAVAAVSDVKSQLVIVASDLLQVYSDSTVIASDLVQVYSDTTRIDSNTVLAETNISDIESSLVIIKSDLVVHESMISDVESSLVIVKSDLIVLDDAVSDVESSLVVVISDIAAISSGSSPDVLVDTTIATLSTQTSFTLTAGSADNDAYNGMAAVFTDQSTAVQKSVRFVSDYVGSTRTVTLESGPGFTIATGDGIAIMAAGASTSLPPPAALVGAQASALTRVQSDLIIVGSDLLQVYSDTTLLVPGVSDIESSILIIKSDLVVIDDLVSDVHSSLVIARSDLLQVYSDSTTIASDLVQVYSDTTRIDSNTVLAETNISDIESSLVIIKSDLVQAISDIGDIEGGGGGGLTLTQASQLTRVQSDIIIVASDLLQVYSDTTLLVPGVSDIESALVLVRSDQTLAESALSDIESSLVIVKSDLVVAISDIGDVSGGGGGLTGTQASQLARVQSDLIIVGSDLIEVRSDTAHIESDVALAEGNISDIESSLVIVKSDLVIVTSDTTAVQAKTDQLTFGVANAVNTNTTHVNEIAIDGAGTALDPFGPA
jgi:hypothetical protein